MAEVDIEGLLRSTAAATIYPVRPQLQGRVALRPATAAGARKPALSLTLSRRARGQAIARLAAMVLVALCALAAALAVEPSREAIARFFGVQGSKIEVLPPGAFPTPLPTSALRPGGPATAQPLSELRFSGVAQEVPLDVLARETGFRPALPPGFGPPVQAYVIAYGSDRVAALEYPGFELWEAQLEGEASFGKGIPQGAIFEQVLVGGNPGYWLSGGPHYVSYNDRQSRYIDTSSRLVEKSTLIWRTDYAFYRIETDLSLEEAMRIAVTLP